jgi:hypothetical protein
MHIDVSIVKNDKKLTTRFLRTKESGLNSIINYRPHPNKASA